MRSYTLYFCTFTIFMIYRVVNVLTCCYNDILFNRYLLKFSNFHNYFEFLVFKSINCFKLIFKNHNTNDYKSEMQVILILLVVNPNMVNLDALAIQNVWVVSFSLFVTVCYITFRLLIVENIVYIVCFLYKKVFYNIRRNSVNAKVLGKMLYHLRTHFLSVFSLLMSISL